MSMLHVDMSYSSFGQLLCTAPTGYAWDAKSFSPILTATQKENCSWWHFIHFPSFLTVLDSSSTSLVCSCHSCEDRKLQPNHHLSFRISYNSGLNDPWCYISWHLMSSRKLVDVLIRGISSYCLLQFPVFICWQTLIFHICFKGSNRTSRCTRASRTKGRESEYLHVCVYIYIQSRPKLSYHWQILTLLFFPHGCLLYMVLLSIGRRLCHFQSRKKLAD